MRTLEAAMAFMEVATEIRQVDPKNIRVFSVLISTNVER
jgi:hypothetical protein